MKDYPHMRFTPHTKQIGSVFRAQIKCGVGFVARRDGTLHWQCTHIHWSRAEARRCAKFKLHQMMKDAEEEAFMKAGR